MNPPSNVHTEDALREFNAQHRATYRLHSRFSSGLQGGAWLLVDDAGRRAILKTAVPDDIPDLARCVERVRASGYPTPRWLGYGSTYAVIEHVEGRSATPLTTVTTPLLLAVLERQAGLAPARDVRRDQPAAGPPELVARFERLPKPLSLPVGDLVHGDFNSCNIMLDGGTVSGVIDVDGLGRGTRVYDYACLLREAYVEDYGEEVRTMIRHAAVAVAGPAVLAACAASAAYFIVGFKQRHEPHRMAEIVARLCRMADDVADLG
jgi:hypothetical protein